MAELKPCPFCGGEAIIHEDWYAEKSVRHKKEIPKGAKLIRSVTTASGNTWHEFRCKAFIPQCMDTKCIGRSYKKFETKEEAIKAWNRRAEDGKL